MDKESTPTRARAARKEAHNYNLFGASAALRRSQPTPFQIALVLWPSQPAGPPLRNEHQSWGERRQANRVRMARAKKAEVSATPAEENPAEALTPQPASCPKRLKGLSCCWSRRGSIRTLSRAIVEPASPMLLSNPVMRNLTSSADGLFSQDGPRTSPLLPSAPTPPLTHHPEIPPLRGGLRPMATKCYRSGFFLNGSIRYHPVAFGSLW